MNRWASNTPGYNRPLGAPYGKKEEKINYFFLCFKNGLSYYLIRPKKVNLSQSNSTQLPLPNRPFVSVTLVR